MSLNSKKSKKERLKFVTKRIYYRVHITSIPPLSNLVIKSIFMDILTTYSTNVVVRPVLGFFFFFIRVGYRRNVLPCSDTPCMYNMFSICPTLYTHTRYYIDYNRMALTTF